MLRTAPEVPENGTILLTGANGYIGSAVGSYLVARGFSVIGLVRSYEAAARIARNGMQPFVMSLDDKDAVKDVASTVDAIVHTASAGPLPDGNIEEMISRSVEAIELLTTISVERSIRLIITSGASMYGDTSHRPANERTKLVTDNFFARLSELEMSLESKRNVTIIRAALVYGRGGSKPLLASLGPMVDCGSLVMASPGHKVSVVHVDDLADLYIKALEKKDVLPVVLGANNIIETEKILLAAADTLNLPREIKTISVERAIQEFSVLGYYTTIDMQIDAAKTKEFMDWQPRHPGIVDEIENRSYQYTLNSCLAPYSSKISNLKET